MTRVTVYLRQSGRNVVDDTLIIEGVVATNVDEGVLLVDTGRYEHGFPLQAITHWETDTGEEPGA